MNDKMVECPVCGGNACYEQHIDEKLITWLCFGCGRSSSTLMEEGSPTHTTLLETSPELYKDLIFVDKNKKVWSPATLTLPGKGMVFVDGTTKENWKWAAVKAIPLTEEDKKSEKFPKDQTVKMDMKNIQYFGQRDFMDACEAIDLFTIE